jgi:hypothetical protein
MTPAQAARTLCKICPNYSVEQILSNYDVFERVRVLAIKRAHPDTGGSHDAGVEINRAVEVLREHWRLQLAASSSLTGMAAKKR